MSSDIIVGSDRWFTLCANLESTENHDVYKITILDREFISRTPEWYDYCDELEQTHDNISLKITIELL